MILDFEGFADFIDAIGGVEVNLRERVKSKIYGGASNGGITLKLDRGEHTLDGQQALALARTRSNARNPTEDDTDRAARQQLILRGIKDRLTSPWRAPINFIGARGSPGTRRRRWSPTWVPRRCPSSRSPPRSEATPGPGC